MGDVGWRGYSTIPAHPGMALARVPGCSSLGISLWMRKEALTVLSAVDHFNYLYSKCSLEFSYI
jgi:hypothetical protein